MANQWTNSDQQKFDDHDSMGRAQAEIEDQKQKDQPQRLTINIVNNDMKLFTFKDLLVAFICGNTTSNKQWLCMKKAHMNIQEAGSNFTSDLTYETFKWTIEELEEEEIVSCNWDIETFCSNV